MNYAQAVLVAIWNSLLWAATASIVLGTLEYFWHVGESAKISARVFNLLIVAAVYSIMGFLSPLIEPPLYAWLIAKGYIGVLFGDWHPKTILELTASTLMFVFVWDFFQYWFHRAEHMFSFLWKVHALHHEEENLNSTTSLRNTIWSAFLHLFLVSVPTTMVCGIHSLSVVGAYLFFRVYGFFNHANIRLDLGPLTPVISGPQWHRIHHGREEEYFNKNFAAFFPIIDIVFGTYRRPAPDEYPTTGLTKRPQSRPTATNLLKDVLGIRAADR